MCTAYKASFSHILQKATVCCSSSVCNYKLLVTSALSKQNSAISLEEWVLVFKMFTTATRMFKVKCLLPSFESFLVLCPICCSCVCLSTGLSTSHPTFLCRFDYLLCSLDTKPHIIVSRSVTRTVNQPASDAASQSATRSVTHSLTRSLTLSLTHLFP